MSSSSSASSPAVAVVGSANQDLTSYTSHVPVLGETVMGNSFETSCGGKGANQARAAAQLNVSPVTMVCRVGQDVFGDALLQELRRSGVAYDKEDTVLTHGSTSSGVATIVVDETCGDNMIIVTPGANHQLTPDNVAKSLAQLKPNVVVVQLEIPYETALQALKTGKELGATTILNPAPAPPDPETLQDFFRHVDILIPNETELRTLCGVNEENDDTEEAMARKLLDLGVNQAVICTLGARGAMIVHKNHNLNTDMCDAPADLPARQQPVVDTIGAGDAFCGALSAYLSVGVDLAKATEMACGFASMSVRRRGATYPTAQELPKSLQVSDVTTDLARALMRKPEITFVTGNKKKLEEVKQILSGAGGENELAFEVVNVKIDLPELQGDPIDIAREKCRLAAEKVKGACFTEDTSLCFHALNGMPGPYIKFFLEKCGHGGLNAMLAGFENKNAYAQTCIAFCPGPGQDIVVFDGRTEGTIVPARGKKDFGWDPIFQPNESNGKTYAEMESTSKNLISHRGRAMEKFRLHLVNQAQTIINAINQNMQ